MPNYYVIILASTDGRIRMRGTGFNPNPGGITRVVRAQYVSWRRYRRPVFA